MQSGWIWRGATDWARLILSESARSSSVDYLAQPWAIPLQEARLSTFLASSQGSMDAGDDAQGGLPDAFLSGQISDLQAQLNVLNLVQNGAVDAPTASAFARLYAALQLPAGELPVLQQNLQRALGAAGTTPGNASGNGQTPVPLLPRSVDQLGWLGVSDISITALRPYVTVLPQRTPVNLNTAPALVLYACIGSLSMADAGRLVAARSAAHFNQLSDAGASIGVPNLPVTADRHSVNSRFFEVVGQLRLDDRVVQEHAVLQRDATVVKVLWRERGAGASLQSGR